MTEATKRIETIRGLYLAGAFALVGALLHSDVGYVGAEVAKIRLDPYLMSTVLLAPLLNSILLIYVASVMHFILAVAKYNTYFLGPRLRHCTTKPVLQFDLWESDEKDLWLLLRGLIGVLFYVLATTISLSVLAHFGAAGRFHLGVVPGLNIKKNSD